MVGKKIRHWQKNRHIGGLSIEEEFKPFAHYDLVSEFLILVIFRCFECGIRNKRNKLILLNLVCNSVILNLVSNWSVIL